MVRHISNRINHVATEGDTDYSGVAGKVTAKMSLSKRTT
jgi:hypothetical protein